MRTVRVGAAFLAADLSYPLSGRDLHVKFFEFLSLPPQIKPLAHTPPPRFSHSNEQLMVLEEQPKMMSKGFNISLGRQEAGLSVRNHLWNSTRIEASHRQAHGLGFCKHHSECLHSARFCLNARCAEDLRTIHPIAHNLRRLNS